MQTISNRPRKWAPPLCQTLRRWKVGRSGAWGSSEWTPSSLVSCAWGIFWKCFISFCSLWMWCFQCVQSAIPFSTVLRWLVFLRYLWLFSEEAMAPHSSTLAWRIPWMEEPGGLPSTGSHRVVHDWSDLALCHYLISLSLNSTYLYVSLNSPPSWSPVLKQFHHLKNHTTIVFIFFFYIKINFLVFQGPRLH